MNVLIVEDDKFQREILGIIIGRVNHNVHYAENSAQAVELATKINYKLIFIDCNLPFFDGLDATKIIRENEKKNSKPPSTIVALTGLDDENIEMECYKSGMNMLLKKPFDTKAITQIMYQVEDLNKV